MPKERYGKLKEYLSLENPILADVITHYEQLDKINHYIGKKNSRKRQSSR